ncbi:hypothetical protein C3K47_06395 [Solitalea longa]|uniref:Uncharacterized protein n=1 Tax=Solitalea longa TaxID=2079460 RepID=A0A2S5A522_9SPHI|nr:hypothetical protein [Solitalea longa]POY37387.1 hypothetical protein C3K47_06395 [Solitalea longa]
MKAYLILISIFEALIGLGGFTLVVLNLVKWNADKSTSFYLYRAGKILMVVCAALAVLTFIKLFIIKM